MIRELWPLNSVACRSNRSFGPVQLLKHSIPGWIPGTEPTLSNSVPPLLCYFPDGLLVGVSCALMTYLMTYLISQGEWKLLLDATADHLHRLPRTPSQRTSGKIVSTDSISTVSVPEVLLYLCIQSCVHRFERTLWQGFIKQVQCCTILYSYSKMTCEHMLP